MRLIDKKELKEWIEGWFKTNKYYHPYSKSNNIPIDELYDILEQMPTIEAEPVKHGHWEKIGTIENTWLVHKCSYCGYQTIDNGQYCPHCGAKMNEVNDD